MAGAFYCVDSGRFVATELTRGPWDGRYQHGGPPAALVGRALETFERRTDTQIARIAFDILRPVPIAALSIDCELVRAGRRVELVEARLRDEQGALLMRASAWRIRAGPVESGEVYGSLPPPPSEGHKMAFFETGFEVGYHNAMDWSFVAGSFRDTGPATVWLRMRYPLIEDEEPSALARALIAADSGNGVSAIVDYKKHLFINCDLGVYLYRLPVGEWVCLQATTQAPQAGLGLTDTALYDERGPIGRSLQSLMIDRR